MATTTADVSGLQELFPHHSQPQLLAALQQQGTFEAALDVLLTTPPARQTSSSHGAPDLDRAADTPPAGATQKTGGKDLPLPLQQQQQQQPQQPQSRAQRHPSPRHHHKHHHQPQQQQHRQQQLQQHVSWGRLESAVKPPSLTPPRQQQQQPALTSTEAFPSLSGGRNTTTTSRQQTACGSANAQYVAPEASSNSNSGRWGAAGLAAPGVGLPRRRSLSAGNLATTTNNNNSIVSSSSGGGSGQALGGPPQSAASVWGGHRSTPHARSAPPSPARAAPVAAAASPLGPQQQQQQQQQQHILKQLERQQHAGAQGVTPPGVATQPQGRDALLMQLWGHHPWADFDLLLAVTHSVDFDFSEASAALQDMQHSTQRAGAASSSKQAAAAAAVDGVEAAQAAAARLQGLALAAGSDQDVHVQQQLQKQAASTAAAVGSPFSSDSEWSEEEGGQASQQQQPGCEQHQLAPAGPDQRGSSSSSGQRGLGYSSSSTVKAVEEDLYRLHRRPALKLTHAWRKAVRRSAAAFGAGYHSGGHALATEARSLRVKALAAHAAAAERIQAAVNAGNGPWELDLHGLHVGEAVHALAQHLAGLEGTGPLLLLPAVATGGAAGVGTCREGEGRAGVMGMGGASVGVHAVGTTSSRSSSRGSSPCVRPCVGAGQQGQAPGVSSAKCAPPSAGAEMSAAAGSVMRGQPGVPSPPGKQAPVLTVIVGRGLHSSEGEASVPRAVENWLMENKYRYRSGVGVWYVHVRRTGVRAT